MFKLNIRHSIIWGVVRFVQHFCFVCIWACSKLHSHVTYLKCSCFSLMWRTSCAIVLPASSMCQLSSVEWNVRYNGWSEGYNCAQKVSAERSIMQSLFIYMQTELRTMWQYTGRERKRERIIHALALTWYWTWSIQELQGLEGRFHLYYESLLRLERVCVTERERVEKKIGSLLLLLTCLYDTMHHWLKVTVNSDSLKCVLG